MLSNFLKIEYQENVIQMLFINQGTAFLIKFSNPQPYFILIIHKK